MKQQWQEYSQKYAMLSARERGLIAGLVLFGIALLGYQFWVEPLQVESTRVERSQNSLNNAIRNLEGEVATLRILSQQDPDETLREQQKQLSQQISELETRLDERLLALVLPEHMASSLALLLAQADNVSLVKMSILDSESLTPEGGLYRHGLELELEGRYFDLQNALLRMEQLEQRFYWRQFDYKVTDFPLARLHLRLDTLGTEQEPIRVGYRQSNDIAVVTP